MKDFALIIPVYNEEKTIEKVIKEVMKYHYPFIIIDDGSTDNTHKILRKNIGNYISYIHNKGKGYAIKKGVKYLIKKGFNWIIVVDSDGQTPIKNIDKLLKLRHLHPNARIIIGNRLNNPLNMPSTRLLINKLMSWVISLITRQYIPDTQCGLKIIQKYIFNLDLKCNGFDFDSEVLIKAGRNGYEIISGDIDCIYFKDRKSKMHPIKDMFRFVKLIVKIIINLKV